MPKGEVCHSPFDLDNEFHQAMVSLASQNARFDDRPERFENLASDVLRVHGNDSTFGEYAATMAMTQRMVNASRDYSNGATCGVCAARAEQ